jgi:hypothetical protein
MRATSTNRRSGSFVLGSGILVGLLAVLAAPIAPAAAKTLCVEDGDGFAWIFPKPKLPKKVGKVSELSGYTRSPFGGIGTVSGTAVRVTETDIAIGVKSLRWGIDAVLGATYLGSIDGDLAGILTQENTFPPETLTLVAIDCDSIPNP